MRCFNPYGFSCQREKWLTYECADKSRSRSAAVECPRFRQASALGVTTIRRAELAEERIALTAANNLTIRRAFEAAGIEFIDENGGGPGVRLKKPPKKRP